MKKWGLLLLTSIYAKIGIPLTEVLILKHPKQMPPAMEELHPYESMPALIDMVIASNIVKCVANMMQGVVGPGGIDMVAWQY